MSTNISKALLQNSGFKTARIVAMPEGGEYAPLTEGRIDNRRKIVRIYIDPFEPRGLPVYKFMNVMRQKLTQCKDYKVVVQNVTGSLEGKDIPLNGDVECHSDEVDGNSMILS